MDVDARVQLFDLKTKYQFQTAPGVDQYNMPLNTVQIETGGQSIAPFPTYQGFFSPALVNGIEVPFYTQRSKFINLWPNYVQQNNAVIQGNGTPGPYTIFLPFAPNLVTDINAGPSGLLRGHIDISGIIAYFNSTTILADPPFVITLNEDIPSTSVYSAFYLTSIDATGNSVVVQDSGQFLNVGGPPAGTNYANLGLLMQQTQPPFGCTSLPGGYGVTSNVIDYQHGIVYVTFPVAIPAGQNINAQCYFYEPGLPRALQFYNNCITLRSVPDKQYLVELDAYLTPAAFFAEGQAIQFAYMCEYIARGAARKILADVGDTEQFMFYEGLFREQEMLVWKRSQRQFTATRTDTIYSINGLGNNGASNGLYGSGAN
jgi:hypothetical protein